MLNRKCKQGLNLCFQQTICVTFFIGNAMDIAWASVFMVHCLSLNINSLDIIQTLSSGDDIMVGLFWIFHFLQSTSHFSSGSQWWNRIICFIESSSWLAHVNKIIVCIESTVVCAWNYTQNVRQLCLGDYDNSGEQFNHQHKWWSVRPPRIFEVWHLTCGHFICQD